MHKKIKHFGFTLIEMLIVIVIIGILAAALVPRLQAVQARARDTKRKADFAQIQNGLHIYKADNNTYPPPGGVLGNTYVYSNGTQPWIAQLSGVMASIPIDPNNGSISPRLAGGNRYAYGNVFSPGNTFSLFAALESATDTSRCVVQGTKVWIGYMYVGCNFGNANDSKLYVLSDIGSH